MEYNLLEMKQSSQKHFVLILDTRGLRILSSFLNKNDLMREGIFSVQLIETPRIAEPNLEAIYFVEPTHFNLEQIINDFRSFEFPKFSKAHVFLTRKPQSTPQDEELFRNIYDECRGMGGEVSGTERPSRLQNLLVTNLDILAAEDYAFHLDLPKSIIELFSEQIAEDDEFKVRYEERIVEGVASVCATLNEFPYVRYENGNSFCEKLGKEINRRIEELFVDDPTFWYHGDLVHSDQPRGTLIILDRRYDLVTPLLHAFSYQNLVYDLLKTRDNLLFFNPQGSFGENMKKARLDESDPVWMKFRYSHVTIVIQKLLQVMNEFTNTDLSNLTIEELSQISKDLPEFSENLARHILHLATLQECMDKVNSTSLLEVQELEQAVVTSIDGIDGEEISGAKIINDLANLMTRDEVDPVDKLRLTCLHCIVLGQASQDVIQTFMKKARLNSDLSFEHAVIGLSNFGISILAANVSTRMLSFRGFTTQKEEVITKYRTKESIQQARRNVLKIQSSANTTLNHQTSRFSPLVKTVCEKFCAHSLEPEEFPFVKPPPPGSGEGGVSLPSLPAKLLSNDRSLSVRKQHGSDESILKIQSSQVLEETDSKPHHFQNSLSGGRLILFIAGGVTYLEICELFKIMLLTRREIIVGGTHFLKPKDFVHDLKVLGGVFSSLVGETLIGIRPD